MPIMCQEGIKLYIHFNYHPNSAIWENEVEGLVKWLFMATEEVAELRSEPRSA